jgi:hypothetical protein
MLGFSNWAVQRCLEAAMGPEERRKIVACMRYVILPPHFLFLVRILMISLHSGRIVDLATNCHGYYVPQKALDCEEEFCLLLVSELLRGNPGTTLVNNSLRESRWSGKQATTVAW